MNEGQGGLVGGDSGYFDAFGNNGGVPVQQQSVAGGSATTSSGDIVIRLEDKKTKKKWIVGGVLMVFCVTLVILLVFIIFQNNKTNSSQDLTKINEEISKYSGVIIYGDGRQVDLSTSVYSDSINYKFRREINDGNREYINSVISEFNSINSLIVEDDSLELTDDDRYYLGLYGDRLQFLKIYAESLDEDPLIIINKIAKEGIDKAASYVETRYDIYINSKNSSLRDYFAYKTEYEKLSIAILRRTNTEECVVENSIVLNCEIEPLMTEEEISRMQEIQNEMKMIVDTNIKYIIRGCWTIYNIVNGVENV